MLETTGKQLRPGVDSCLNTAAIDDKRTPSQLSPPHPARELNTSSCLHSVCAFRAWQGNICILSTDARFFARAGGHVCDHLPQAESECSVFTTMFMWLAGAEGIALGYVGFASCMALVVWRGHTPP